MLDSCAAIQSGQARGMGWQKPNELQQGQMWSPARGNKKTLCNSIGWGLTGWLAAVWERPLGFWCAASSMRQQCTLGRKTGVQELRLGINIFPMRCDSVLPPSPSLTFSCYPAQAITTSDGCVGCIWSKQIQGRQITTQQPRAYLWQCNHRITVQVNVWLKQNLEAAISMQIWLWVNHLTS